jgi:hypothetical protein
MHRFTVNFTIAIIFKGILEMWNLAQNGKKFAKKWPRNVKFAAVYHARIYHGRPSCGLYASFMDVPAVSDSGGWP